MSKLLTGLPRLSVLTRVNWPPDCIPWQTLSATYNYHFTNGGVPACPGDRRGFSTSALARAVYKLKNDVKDCYFLLGVAEDCSMEELREAYLRRAKLYHPDSQSSTADPKKFDQVKEAYNAIKEHRKDQSVYEILEDDDEETGVDSTRRAPQHRQFLSFEGVGSGTISQRQKQYEQVRVSRAAENVQKYKLKQMAVKVEEENALQLKEKRAARRAKMSNSIDRLVEDLILKSMSEGDFDNLAGKGKPLDLNKKDRNHFVDSAMQRFNQILIDEGSLPEWVGLEKEIREDVQKARGRLAVARTQLGAPPYRAEQSRAWNRELEHFKSTLVNINTKIDKYNLIVPILAKQKIPFTQQKEIDRVLGNHEQYLPLDWDKYPATSVGFRESPSHRRPEGIEWKDVWKNIKEMFRNPAS